MKPVAELGSETTPDHHVDCSLDEGCYYYDYNCFIIPSSLIAIRQSERNCVRSVSLAKTDG